MFSPLAFRVTLLFNWNSPLFDPQAVNSSQQGSAEITTVINTLDCGKNTGGGENIGCPQFMCTLFSPRMDERECREMASEVAGTVYEVSHYCPAVHDDLGDEGSDVVPELSMHFFFKNYKHEITIILSFVLLHFMLYKSRATVIFLLSVNFVFVTMCFNFWRPVIIHLHFISLIAPSRPRLSCATVCCLALTWSRNCYVLCALK